MTPQTFTEHILAQAPGAVIFDLDGTLLDTEPLYSVASQRILDRYGCIYTPELKKRAMGGSSTRSAQLVIDEYELPLTANEYLTWRGLILFHICANVSEIDDAGQFVTAIKQAGIPLGLATSSNATLSDQKLGDRPWADFFDVFICGDHPNLFRSKPNPDIFLLCADQLQMAPEQCIVFEDSPNGVEAAKRAGMQVCALLSPYADRRDLSRADCVFSSYRDLMTFIANWS